MLLSLITLSNSMLNTQLAERKRKKRRVEPESNGGYMTDTNSDIKCVFIVVCFTLHLAFDNSRNNQAVLKKKRIFRPKDSILT